ncbi:Sirohydrochlorin cobaltochelatase [Candidatus Methylomirabilis lanthanidiphila]|uniref:Sirohydrochlorin cobaltochelatase n=1 Tax=Candidatus Methylomirabilis lanthanidiphila TaxID=2211376 RepID=A0A564ZG28_9BACT|nr:sirohydrochlorin chelatase [Candidatus Methylomirabilis lanthanidiphila]VUZ84280.1 Sirohydrochlorin cobaltochelatase [Candidatus Methylomirabilis lanthanidiphila]
MTCEVVLLVGHGSREPSGNEEFLQLSEQMRKAVVGAMTEVCFVDSAEPDIPTGLDACVRMGAQEVVVLPVMLFAAGHVKVEIPSEIDLARVRHPEIRFRYGRPFGLHPKMLQILDQRLGEIEGALPGAPEETAVLLVGRGSSDPDANGDVCKLARLLWERRRFGWVESCFIGITKPDFAEGVRRCVALGARRLLILPYLLFSGVLIRRIGMRLHELQRLYPNIAMGVARYLEGHPNLVTVLLERYEEARYGTAVMNCEICKQRVLVGHEAVTPLPAAVVPG